MHDIAKIWTVPGMREKMLANRQAVRDKRRADADAGIPPPPKKVRPPPLGPLNGRTVLMEIAKAKEIWARPGHREFKTAAIRAGLAKKKAFLEATYGGPVLGWNKVKPEN